MSTEIQWTDETWNPTRGCSKVSKGCESCYAMRQAHRFSGPGQPYDGLTHVVHGKGPQWSGEVRTVPEALTVPLRWRKPRRVFVDSMSDLFHSDVPFNFVDRVYDVMCKTPEHIYQILTKRPERMAEFYGAREPEGALIRPPLPNVWLGTSVENQAAADERISYLLRCPAAVRFLSCEPLLGPVTLTVPKVGEWPHDPPVHATANPEEWDDWKYWMARDGGIKWLIAGGESGHGARPCDVAWIRSLVRQCQEAAVPCFVKQLGAHPWDSTGETRAGAYTPGGFCCGEFVAKGSVLHLRDPKGGDPDEWPEDLRVRQFPQTQTPTR